MALNALVETGLPQGTSILLVGPPGSGKTSFCLQLAIETIHEGQEALYLSTENTPTTIIEHAHCIGLLSPDKSIEIKFIDAFSWAVGTHQDALAVDRITNPSDINKVNLVVMEQAQILKPGSLVVIDSVSGLTLATQRKDRIRTFIHVLSQRMIQLSKRIIFVLEEGAHNSALVNSLRSLVQGTIQTRMANSANGSIRRELRIPSLVGATTKTSWAEVQLEGGFHLVGGADDE